MRRSTLKAVSPLSTDILLPTHEEIAASAYSRYLERGGLEGSDLDDWLHAERELLETRLGGEHVAHASTSTRP